MRIKLLLVNVKRVKLKSLSDHSGRLFWFIFSYYKAELATTIG